MPSTLRFESKRTKKRLPAGRTEAIGESIVTLPEDPEDNRIFVQPAWAAQAKPAKRGLSWLLSRVIESRFVEALRFEIKALLWLFLLGFLVFMTFVGARSFYKTKSEAGVDLSPIHGPNLVPFIRQ